MTGWGTQPLGSSPYGIGEPATGAAPGTAVLTDPATGRPAGARRIQDGDYAYGSDGRALGMPATRQLVLIALGTVRGSSAMTELGHDLRSIVVVTDAVERHIRVLVEAALAHLTARRLIELLSTATTVTRPGVVSTHVRWRDISAGTEDHADI